LEAISTREKYGSGFFTAKSAKGRKAFLVLSRNNLKKTCHAEGALVATDPGTARQGR
jgi:hypothetical protein